MSVLMSWARSTLASIDHAVGRDERWFDRILMVVIAMLAVAIVFLFTAS
jgi:hypothetical protein